MAEAEKRNSAGTIVRKESLGNLKVGGYTTNGSGQVDKTILQGQNGGKITIDSTELTEIGRHYERNKDKLAPVDAGRIRVNEDALSREAKK